MGSKVRTLIIAIAFGVAATALAGMYIAAARAKVEGGEQARPVLVAVQAVPAGTAVQDLMDGGLVERQLIPRKYVASDGLESLNGYRDQVLVASLSEGEQVAAADFRTADKADMALRIAAGKIAVAIPVDVSSGLSGSLRAGDRVSVMATLAPGPGGADITKRMLANVLVLAVDFGPGKGSGMGQGSMPAKGTVTLAASPGDAEKLVFVQEQGHIWLALEPGRSDSISTSGQTVESVFK